MKGLTFLRHGVVAVALYSLDSAGDIKVHRDVSPERETAKTLTFDDSDKNEHINRLELYFQSVSS